MPKRGWAVRTAPRRPDSAAAKSGTAPSRARSTSRTSRPSRRSLRAPPTRYARSPRSRARWPAARTARRIDAGRAARDGALENVLDRPLPRQGLDLARQTRRGRDPHRVGGLQGRLELARADEPDRDRSGAGVPPEAFLEPRQHAFVGIREVDPGWRASRRPPLPDPFEGAIRPVLRSSCSSKGSREAPARRARRPGRPRVCRRERAGAAPGTPAAAPRHHSGLDPARPPRRLRGDPEGPPTRCGSRPRRV